MMSPKIFVLLFFRNLERAFKKLHRPWVMHRLRAVNASSQQKITAEGGPIVSLTTYDKRFDIVFYTIESIAKGSLLPSRITLWVDEKLCNAPLPPPLERLQARGLEIKSAEDLGPHTKYFPEVTSERDAQRPFITADDDTLYPRYWLERLHREHLKHPGTILCYRARKISFSDTGRLLPYGSWLPCFSTTSSPLHFSTGVCGALFPGEMRDALRSKSKEFESKCLRADDIWLNWVAVNAGIPVKQIVLVHKKFYEVPGTREFALANRNNRAGGNDIQLEKTYSADVLAHLFERWKNSQQI
ncbi:MAG: hypothetical protein KTR17_11350 [Cellvibrionaceae bacterium]|nr:hypothetical protein [Cellvibrionaceae bacterium]